MKEIVSNILARKEGGKDQKEKILLL